MQGVIDLYTGLLHGKRDLVVHAYETWGFAGLSNELIDVLNIWARFIYGPLLDDREREIAEGTTPGQYGRKEAFTVHKALKEKGPVKVPREFVFMDRAAIGLGGVFLHLARAAQLARHVQRDDRGLRARRRSARGRRRRSRRPACRCRRSPEVAATLIRHARQAIARSGHPAADASRVERLAGFPLPLTLRAGGASSTRRGNDTLGARTNSPRFNSGRGR